MLPFKKNAIESYFREPSLLGREGLLKILDEGKKWDLSETLKNGGSVIFPHAHISECGYQIACAVHACLNSSARTVLVLGVLHSLTDEIFAARQRENLNEDLSTDPLRGIFSDENSPLLEKEHSLHFFKILWDVEISRRSHPVPKLIFKYPFLVNRAPKFVPGMEELNKIAEDSIVIATADLCHYGKAYGCEKEKPINDNSSLLFAKKSIEKGFEILESGDYAKYYDHCWQSLSDSSNSCSVLRYLLGPLKATIRDIKLIDVASLFKENPSPSWVATTLVEMKKIPD